MQVPMGTPGSASRIFCALRPTRVSERKQDLMARTSPFTRAATVVFSLLFTLAAVGQNSPMEHALASTTRLMQALQQYSRNPNADSFVALENAAAARQSELLSLMKKDPGAVLQAVLPADLDQQIPPAVQPIIEQRVTLSGELEVKIEDGRNYSKIHYGLKVAGQHLELHFADHAPAKLLSGMFVKVDGVQVGNMLALSSSGTTSISNGSSTSVLPNTFGPQSTLVMLVNFQDNATQPYSLTSAHDLVFGSGGSVTNFDLENSFQQTWLTGDAVGWYTLPISSTTCDINSIANYANQAATAAGINLAKYSHYVYAFPQLNCFGWWGLSTVGGSPSQSWINGSFQLKVVGHELGHAFGLYHSHALSCSGTTLCSNGTIVEYGDALDIMGNPTSGAFSAFQKERLGWLNYGVSPSINVVQSSGTYTIGPYENQDGTTKALKILQSTDPTTGTSSWYYVEYRQASGVDSFLSNNSNVQNGVVIHSATDSDPNSNSLLNMAPSQSNFYYSALDVGQSFIDPSAGLTVSTVAASPTEATVNVAFGTPTCTHFNPTISLSPSQSLNVPAGTSVSYTVSVKNNDNAGCNATTFNLSNAVSAGWTGVLSDSSLSIAYGGTASTVIQITSPNNAATGQYSFNVSASDAVAPSFVSTASAVYNLNTTPCAPANPTVTLSPSQSPSQQPGMTYTYVLGVTNNDSSSCNSSTYNLGGTVPSGWTGVLGIPSLTIAPGGKASTSLNVTSPTSASAGSYGISGTATNSASSSSGSATATYVIAGTGSTCTRANPTVTMSPSQSQSVAPGTAVSYTVSVKDNDGSGCATTNFNLNANLLSGWGGTWNTSILALSPGGSGSAILTVASPTSTTSGSYNVGTTATDGSATSYYGSASASYVTSASTNNTAVSVTTNNSSYLPGQTVGIMVALSSGGAPVSGASVSVAVTNANGGVNTLTGTTGSNGSVKLNYKLKKQAPAGTYKAQASAAAAVASTSFMVQ